LRVRLISRRSEMSKYRGYLKHIQYFEIEVDADSMEEAQDQMWEFDVNWSKPCDMDSELVDIEEIQNA
jgi:hypothetical protein